jgi:hypothetical protein
MSHIRRERWWHRYLPIRRGRNWMRYEWGSQREDGWWLLGYWVWVPQPKWIFQAILFRLVTGNNNLLYTPERRKRMGMKEEE